jgi:hypothetical protein
MNPQGFRTVLFLTFILIFLLTAAVTLLALTGVIVIPEAYLKPLFSTLVVETVGAVVMLFKTADFFNQTSSATNRLSDRQLALDGSWQGEGRQEIGPGSKPFDAAVLLNLKVTTEKIRGVLKFSFNHPITHKLHEDTFNIEGSFMLERFLQLEYKNVIRSQIQFGSIIFELDSDPSLISGRYLGYGVESKQIIYGTLKLQKIA